MPDPTLASEHVDTSVEALTVRFPSMGRILAEVISQWPDHASFIERRFKNDSADFLSRSEKLADDILRLTGDNLSEYCSDYRWMCDEFVKEEIFFQRNKRYRLSTLQEAQQSVYDNSNFMKQYMFGLLVSQILWRNHACVFDTYVTDFLGAIEQPFQHLEVGPGHGLFLHRAAIHPLCQSAHGWDISETSLGTTAHALAALQSDDKVKLEHRDVAVPNTDSLNFDTVVISEVLEHVEQPNAVLGGLVSVMRPGGSIFINVPVNSPAPDHIYLWREPEEIAALAEDAGIEVVREFYFPATGFSLEQARKANITISVVVIGRRTY